MDRLNRTMERIKSRGGGLHVKMDYDKSVVITEPETMKTMEVFYNGIKNGQACLTFKSEGRLFEIRVSNGRSHRGSDSE